MTQIARLDSRALVRISGADGRAFLHNLLTQNVETLSDGDLRFAALLSPPGRLLFDLFVVGDGEDVVLDVARDRRDALIQRLSVYRLRARIEIAADERPVFASWPEIERGFTADPRTLLLGGRCYGGDHQTDATQADFDAHRLAVGVPDPAGDGGSDTAYPIEANFDLLNGIDFSKGCFVGQETTSRMKRRGEIKKRMLPLTFEGPAPSPGSEVLNGALRAGTILTGHGGGATALLRLDRLDGALTVDERAVTVWWPEWMAPAP